jgi:putative glutathione S-transferase
MGMLVGGEWKDVWYDTASTGGRFVRKDAAFRDVVGSEPGARFLAERERYHLYVSLACPWAHRVLIVRALKGLEEVLPISVVDPLMADQGWVFSDGPGCIRDPLFGAEQLHSIYRRAKPRYTGRVTVPVLWDKKEGTIVNNESSEILRMLNAAFDGLATRTLADLYPLSLRAEIDAVNERVLDTVNNGVYKAGFATTQEAYEAAFAPLFETLAWLDARLAGRRFLLGEALTEADIRLFTTLVRFDAVYHGHFKCNLQRLVDYEHLWPYARSLYQLPFVKETVDFVHIKGHYYRSHVTINPTRIVPVGPRVDWQEPVPAR